MRKEYTVAVHVQRLERMLLRKNPCGCCPAQRYYRPGGHLRDMWPDGGYPCDVCCEFAGVQPGRWDCPCNSFGPEEARRITREKLNEYYREVGE